MKNLFVCLLVMVFGVSAQAKDAVEEGNVIKVVEVSSSMSMVEKKVRQASVRVLSGNGHGSGSLIEYYDLQLVVTAQHVASGAIGSQYMLQIMLNTYGWFGCSGSVIYNSKGQVVGILWGVDVEKRPDLQVQENMVWVVPVHNLDMQAAIQPICVALPDTPKACSINVR